MARHKVITPVFENSKEKQEKNEIKRNVTIFRIFSCIFAVLLIAGIIITGTNYDNDLIFGWGYIILGCITLLACIFIAYTEIKGWFKRYPYWEKRKVLPDEVIDKDELKKEVRENSFLMIFATIIFLGLAVYMLVLGIRALLGFR